MLYVVLACVACLVKSLVFHIVYYILINICHLKDFVCWANCGLHYNSNSLSFFSKKHKSIYGVEIIERKAKGKAQLRKMPLEILLVDLQMN